MQMFSQRFIERVESGATTDLDGIHGRGHWERVWRNAERLAEELDDGKVSLDFLALFALFHDSQRLNDEDDPEHGARAAEYLEACYQKALDGDPDLSELADYPRHLIRAVKHACEIHTACQPDPDADFGFGWEWQLSITFYNRCTAICMDADRLDIWRVDEPVDAGFLFTDKARTIVVCEYIDGYPENHEQQLQNIFPAPIAHIADMTKAQRDTIRRLYRYHEDDCFAELDLLLRAHPSTNGSVTLHWCGSDLVIDTAGRPAAKQREGGPELRGLFGTAAPLPVALQRRPLYHYTTWRGLVAILASGEIRPSCFVDRIYNCGEHLDHPHWGVWCSHAREIERAAPGTPDIDYCPTDVEALEEYNQNYGLARIEVNPAVAPLTAGSEGDIPMCELLCDARDRFGALPEEWRIGKSPIRSRDWFSIQEWSREDGWQSIELSKNPRIRAIWPLLPLWMRTTPEREWDDPDYRFDSEGSTLRGCQIQRFVERFESGRQSFWFLLARGEFNGALALAVDHAERGTKFDGHPPVDKAACMGDLALWHWIYRNYENAEMLTAQAAQFLYGDARLTKVFSELRENGFARFIEDLVRESPNNPNVRGSEITIPVALYLSMGHQLGKIESHADEISSALCAYLSGHATAAPMAEALSQWIGTRNVSLPGTTSTRGLEETPYDDFYDN